MPHEALIWKRTQNNSKSFAKDYKSAEKTMLEYPEFVFFGPTIVLENIFLSYPCKISSASKILVRVSSFEYSI